MSTFRCGQENFSCLMVYGVNIINFRKLFPAVLVLQSSLPFSRLQSRIIQSLPVYLSMLAGVFHILLPDEEGHSLKTQTLYFHCGQQKRQVPQPAPFQRQPEAKV